MNAQLQTKFTISRNSDPGEPHSLAKIFEVEKAIAAMTDPDFLALEQEVAANPRDGFRHLWLGLALAARLRDQEASDAYVKAIACGCHHWRIGWYLAQSARRLGQLDIVDQCCAQILKLCPEFWFAREFPRHARGYYSQMDQDRVIEEFFAQNPAPNRVFVEVGAFDGVHYSNVRRLHERHGWTGVSVEPIAKNFAKLSNSYKGTSVQCVRAAVSNTEGVLEMNVSTYPHLPDWGSDVASLSNEGTERWKRQYGAQWTKEKVSAKKLATILREAGIGQIDLLSVDAEGHDLEVLKSLDFSRFQPQLIVIEYGSQREAIARLLAEQGYSLLLDNNQDLIAARLKPLPMPGHNVPATKNFTGLSGKPGYEEIQREMELRLDRWLEKPSPAVERIVIVGGYYGHEIRAMLKSYPAATIHVFEPSRRYFPKLKAAYANEPRVECHQFAVSDQPGIATFNEGAIEGVGSLLPLKTQADAQTWIPDNFRPAESYQVKVITLDDFAPLRGQPIDLLWGDVQGAELKILAGARETLKRTQALFLEVATTKMSYHGQCKLGDLNLFCRDHGFYLAGIGLCPTGNGTGNALWLRANKCDPDHGGSLAPSDASIPQAAPANWQAKINPHLFKIKYLQADAQPMAKVVPASQLITPQRFDLAAKTLYVRHRLLNVQSGWARNVYCEHISAFSGGTCREGDERKSNIEDYLNSFHSLIESVRTRNFDPAESLVPCGRADVIIDGAHRVAACAALGREVSVLTFDRDTNNYGSGWFRSRGLSPAACDAIALEYCRLRPDTYMVMVFPAAQGKDESVAGILSGLGNIVYEKQIQISRQGSFNLIRQVYAGEPWLGTWRNQFAGAWGKANPCFATPGPLRAYLFQTDNPEKVRSAKQQIRQLFGIENHSVHINDTHAQTLQLARLLFNDNSIHFLNHAQPKFFERFERQMENYQAWLRSTGADPELFCIDGSAVMAAYGIRVSADLDVLHFPPADFSAVNPEVNSHNSEIHHHVLGRDEIIFNPEHHFYFNGLKFASLDLIRQLKVKRNEGKDRVDVQLINTLLGENAPGAAPATFTNNWFGPHEPHWDKLLVSWARPRGPLNILEVGSYEGRSSVWFLNRIMNNPASRLTCVDPWLQQTAIRVYEENMDEVFRTFQANIKSTGREGQVTTIRGESTQHLPALPAASFDLVYVDGDHSAEGVYRDTLQAFRLVKEGGLILWDDYYWAPTVREGVDKAAAELGIKLEPFGNNVSYIKQPTTPETASAKPAHPMPVNELPPAAAACVVEADQLCARGEFAQAVEQLERALQAAPDSVELLSAMGTLQARLGAKELALAALKRACALSADNPSLLAKLAAAHINAGQVPEFEAVMARALELDPENREVLGLLAELHVRQAEFANAAQIYARIIAQAPRDVDALLGVARCFAETGDLQTAAASYKQVLEIAPSNRTAAEQLMKITRRPRGPGDAKIVGLVPARNESQRLAFCLRALAQYTDAIVYLDDCSTDDSVAVVESLARECNVERIIRKESWHRDEPGDRNAMLQAGREIGGTHFIILDADEVFTANCAKDDFLRRHLLNLRPGERLALTWIQLWRSTSAYRFDGSVWTHNMKAFAFCDDGRCGYQSAFIHTSRVPDNLQGRTTVLGGYVHGVLHFQFVNWRNLQIKQSWYRCLERIRRPKRPVAEINTQYAPSEDETGLVTRETPADWFAGYHFFDPAAPIAPDERRLAEVRDWFSQYGQNYFAGLHIWHVDWGIDAQSNELAAQKKTLPVTAPAQTGDRLETIQQLISALDQGDEIARNLSIQLRVIHWQYNGFEHFCHERAGAAEAKAARLLNQLDPQFLPRIAPLENLDAVTALVLGLAAEVRKDLQTAWASYSHALMRPSGGILGFRLAIRLARIAAQGGDTAMSDSVKQDILPKLRASLPDRLNADVEEKAVLAWPPIVNPSQKPAPTASKATAPLVTAIVSTFKSERFIRGCLEDLEAQTIADRLEIIVVDSHSPQNERAIVEEFQKRYSNIVYIRTEDRETVYGAWSRGARAARGKYLTNANTDDRHRADAFEIVARALDKNSGVSLVYADCLITDNENEMYDTANPSGVYSWLDFNAQDLWTKGCFCGPQPMWRREVHGEHGYFDAQMISAGDYEFWLRLAQNRKFLHVREVLGLYLKSPTSVEHANRDIGAKEVELSRARYRDSIMAGKPPFRPNLPDPTVKVEIMIGGDTNPAATHPPVAKVPDVSRVGQLNEARELFAAENFEAAWNAALTAIAHRPFHPAAFLLLAEIAQAVGDGKSAKRCVRFVRELAPGWAAAKQFANRPLKGDATPKWLVLPEEIRTPHSALRNRLSICLIVKNEERFLAQCLKSVRGLAAQTIVVDTGSTDRTVEIAREFGAEIYSFAWCDDFAAARNAALEHATGDWILMLDADEELPAAQHAALLAEMKKTDAIAIRLPLVNVGKETEGRSFVPRLFRNAPEVFFTGRIHEQVFSCLLAHAKTWGLKSILGAAQLLHHGYTSELVRDRNKVERNLKLLREALAENPADANLLMNLGLELARSEDLAGGIEKYREAYEVMSLHSTESAPELREVLLTQFTSQLYKVRGHDEVVEVLTSPLAQRGGLSRRSGAETDGLTASLHFALGLAYFELKQFSEAASQMRQCLAKRRQPCLTPINTDILTAAPQHCLALSLMQLGEKPAAEKAFIAALAETGHAEAAKLDYAKYLRTENRPVEALNQLHDLVTANPRDLAAWQLGGDIALGNPEFLEFARDWTAEAFKALPENPVIAAHRAEALMLGNDPAAAIPLWHKLWSCEPEPRILAALILCQLAASQPAQTPNAGPDELAASRAFVEWYQKLIASRASKLIETINDRLEALSQTLPTAGQMLTAALSEVEAPQV